MFNSDITSCIIDSIQSKASFNGKGTAGEVADPAVLTKAQLGEKYGLKAYSPIGKEWFEQAAAFEDYLVGKKVSEINLEDSSLLAGCTMYAGAYEAACDNAVDSTLYNSKAITL